MAWAESRSHLVVAAILFGFDVVIGFALVILSGFSSSGSCGDHSIVYGVSLVAAALLIATILALVKKRYRLFSRLSLYSFLFLIFGIPILLASVGSSRCKGEISFVKSNVIRIQMALSIYHDENNSYPASLEDLAPKYLSQTSINSIMENYPYRYEKKDSSYSLCTTIKRTYYYGIPTNSGEHYCVDSLKN